MWGLEMSIRIFAFADSLFFRKPILFKKYINLVGFWWGRSLKKTEKRLISKLGAREANHL